MTTPWSIKLNKPWVFGFHHVLIEVSIIKNNNLYFGVSTATFFFASLSSTTTAAAATTSTHSLLNSLLGLLQYKICDCCWCSLTSIIYWGVFILSEKLQRWESRNSKRSTNIFMLIHVYCSYVDYALKMFSHFIVLWGETLAMSTPFI